MELQGRDGEAELVPKGTVRIAGVPGSPYTRKVLATLRYRRIPFRYIVRGGRDDVGLRRPPGPPLLPNVIFDDGEPMADSTPIIARLEQQFLNDRAVYPPYAGLAFLNQLIEDYADEWHTKHMFHYRWWFKADTEKAGKILPLFCGYDLDEETYKPMVQFITERQVSRVNAVTGSNQVTAPVIEDSYHRLLRVLEAHFAAGHRFLFGERPSSADFALYGQFTCLALFDPTPARIAEREAPRVVGFTHFLDDASGLQVSESDWVADIGPTLRAILVEVGRLYGPFMVANAAAVARGDKVMNAVLDGKPYIANTFPYQAKCLRWLQEDYAKLDSRAREFVDTAISGTGLADMLAASSRL